jgi:hypothetical protein
LAEPDENDLDRLLQALDELTDEDLVKRVSDTDHLKPEKKSRADAIQEADDEEEFSVRSAIRSVTRWTVRAAGLGADLLVLGFFLAIFALGARHLWNIWDDPVATISLLRTMIEAGALLVIGLLADRTWSSFGNNN